MAESSKKIAKRKQFYSIESRSGTSHAWQLVNGDRLQLDHFGLLPKVEWPDGRRATTSGPWRIPQYLEPPKFLVDRKLARKFKDYEGSWISTRMKELIETFAPDTCLFERCQIELDDGERGPEFWQWSVKKVFRDSVNVSKSENIRSTEDGRYIIIDITKQYLYAFKPEVIGNTHLFRCVEFWIPTYCDEHFRDACREMKITGIDFRKIGHLDQ